MATQGLRDAARSLQKAHVSHDANPVTHLYRQIVRNVPKILALYNINMDPAEARERVQEQFRKHSEVKDQRVVDMLVIKGNMELEETLLQWKQKTHVMRYLDPLEAEGAAGIFRPALEKSRNAYIMKDLQAQLPSILWEASKNVKGREITEADLVAILRARKADGTFPHPRLEDPFDKNTDE